MNTVRIDQVMGTHRDTAMEQRLHSRAQALTRRFELKKLIWKKSMALEMRSPHGSLSREFVTWSPRAQCWMERELPVLGFLGRFIYSQFWWIATGERCPEQLHDAESQHPRTTTNGVTSVVWCAGTIKSHLLLWLQASKTPSTSSLYSQSFGHAWRDLREVMMFRVWIVKSDLLEGLIIDGTSLNGATRDCGI